ncbi:MAG: GNAT family N-acetyltransferase [Candidatus Polarisedimenticolaceae bacterium]|nr:GNAT family N-acetyltransferase [Candidatus Polarisedimenticolaceae bacterium]
MQTPRLILRNFRADDVDDLATILSDPLVMKFSSKGPLSKEETLSFINWCIGSYEKYGYGSWAVVDRETNVLIGLCGLSHTEIDGEDEVQIGYRLSQCTWGKGLATEAGREVLRLGFEKHKLSSIISIVSLEHNASIGVSEKIGFSDYSVDCYCGWDVRIYRKNINNQESMG